MHHAQQWLHSGSTPHSTNSMASRQLTTTILAYLTPKPHALGKATQRMSSLLMMWQKSKLESTSLPTQEFDWSFEVLATTFQVVLLDQIHSVSSRIIFAVWKSNMEIYVLQL